MPDETLTYTNDHDLLIDMRRILLDLREDFKEVKNQTNTLQSQVTVLHTEWTYFKGVGKFLWAGITSLISILVGIGVHFLWFR